MLTLCIRYTLDHNKLGHFEGYARTLLGQIERSGGKLLGYFVPTKVAGRTDTALALIDFADLASYEQYRAKLMADPEAAENVRRVEASGVILNEERSFLHRVTAPGE